MVNIFVSLKTYKILGPSVSAQPCAQHSNQRATVHAWRECCAVASAWLTCAHYAVSLLTDFAKL